jgi:hypothetical protein
MRIIPIIVILTACATSEDTGTLHCGSVDNPQPCSTDSAPSTTEADDLQHVPEANTVAAIQLPLNSTNTTEEEVEYCKPVKTAWRRKLENILGKLGFSRRERVWVCTKSDGSIRLVYTDPKGETVSSTSAQNASDAIPEITDPKKDA